MLTSSAHTISAMRCTLALVSVTTREFPAAFEVMLAEGEISGVRSCRSRVASMYRNGITCVMTSSVVGIRSG